MCQWFKLQKAELAGFHCNTKSLGAMEKLAGEVCLPLPRRCPCSPPPEVVRGLFLVFTAVLCAFFSDLFSVVCSSTSVSCFSSLCVCFVGFWFVVTMRFMCIILSSSLFQAH